MEERQAGGRLKTIKEPGNTENEADERAIIKPASSNPIKEASFEADNATIWIDSQELDANRTLSEVNRGTAEEEPKADRGTR